MLQAMAVLAVVLLLGSNALVAFLTSAPAQAATCDDTWMGPATGGDWGIGPWSAGIPTSTSHACITGADVTVSDVSLAGGLTMSGGSLTISTGSLELADTTFTSTINNLDLSGGMLQADDGPSSETVDLTGSGTWTAGTIGAGSTAGDPDSVVVITPGASLTVSGPNAGDAPNPPAVGAGTALRNDGTLDWNAGYFCVSGDGLTNESDGTFDVDGSALQMLDCNMTSAPLTNDGTMNVTAPIDGGFPFISNNFTQNGTLAIATVLNVNGNFTSGAAAIFEPSLTAAGNGAIYLNGSTEMVGGTIQPIVASGFVPSAGQQFVVVACDGTCTGSYPPVQDGFDVVNNGGEVVLTAVAAASPSPNPLAFPATPIDSSSAPLTETLSNPGSAPLTVTATAVSGPSAA
ncbi:MAG TPA: hypothetical protein VKY26_09315, partial [Actinomycetota bacterium]|nr:hypothetical protein [Actinomycetota bacterium]